MKLTNHFNLPNAIINAIKGFEHEYTKGRGATDISVTQLIQPPLIKQLTDKHRDEIEEDASDRIWSLIGSAVHGILEHAGGKNDLTEERLFVDVNGVKLSGQADLYEGDSTLSDYKVTSVWSVIGDKIKPEWEQQLNLLAYLYRKAGFKVNRLQVVAILRDWSKGKAKQGSYPQCNVKVISIPNWTYVQTEAFIEERIGLHSSEPLECTPAEKWTKPTVYATMKKGRKSAIKLYDNLEDAEADKRGTYVETRLGENTRCESYCSVSKFCPYKGGGSDD